MAESKNRKASLRARPTSQPNPTNKMDDDLDQDPEVFDSSESSYQSDNDTNSMSTDDEDTQENVSLDEKLHNEGFANKDYSAVNQESNGILEEIERYEGDEKLAKIQQSKLNASLDHQTSMSDLESRTDSDSDLDSDDSVASKPHRKEGPVRKTNAAKHYDQEQGFPTQDAKAKYKNVVFKPDLGWNDKLAPVSTIDGLFRQQVEKTKNHPRFQAMIDHLRKQPIRLATMCSGTECPVIAMEYFSDLLAQSGYKLNFEHVFSAEIEPFKQAYILRNFPGVTLFEDITEMGFVVANPTDPQVATTVYGSKVPIPCNVDILVTGFCCVDFSRLNNVNKTLLERGESGDTLFAIMSYAEKAKPKFILFENVVNAPWLDSKYKGNGRGIDILMKRIGYSVRHMKLDTKEFGLPQTRNRGYMLCVLDELFGESFPLGSGNTDQDDDPPTAARIEAQKWLDDWAALVLTFKMQASVSAETMILAMQDDISSSLDRVEVLDDDEKAVAWDKCKAEHHRFREDLRLGCLRTLTMWEETGYKKFLDHYMYLKGATSRVLDTLEILHLQNAMRGFDDIYFSRMRDLSQNVYRSNNNQALGNVGCLTPRGAMFASVWGRKLTGLEFLTLQGIPIYRMDVAHLSESQLQDLAGNAMSSTVVGACLQALQLTFFEFFEQGDGTYKKPKKIISQPEFVHSEGFSQVDSFIDVPARYLSVHDAIQHAVATAQLCSCETRGQLLHKKFKKCQICNHTACQDHFGNPVHCYQDLLVTRGIPTVFEKILKAALPKKISFGTENTFKIVLKDLAARHHDRIDQKLWYENYYLDAFQSDLQWKSIRRSDIWEVIYESHSAKLVLEISALKAEWLLYAKVESHLPGNDHRRVLLEKFPIARMSPTDGIFGPGNWQFWLPKQYKIKARIVWSGNFVPSWKASLGLVDFLDTYVLDKCSIEVPEEYQNLFSANINGDYHLKQGCGQAMKSLHIKMVDGKPPIGVDPMFLFLEHERKTGNWDLHRYAFTNTTRSIEYGTSRQNIAQLDSGIGQPEFTKVVTATGDEYRLARFHRAEKEQNKKLDYNTTHNDHFEHNDGANISLDGTWVDCPSLDFYQGNPERMTFKQLPPPHVISSFHRDCRTPRAVFSCSFKIPESTAELFLQEEWVLVDSKVARAFYDCFLSKFLNGLVINDYTEDNVHWNQIESSSDHKCLSCSPKPPGIFWAFGKNNKQCAFEEPEEASKYEQAIKNRANPIHAVYFISKGFSSSDRQLTFTLGINPESLAHIARSLLASNTSVPDLEIRTEWCLFTDYASTSRPILPSFGIPNTREMTLAGQNLKYNLRPEQLRSVQWQVEQESNPPAFREEEIVESGVQQLCYRLFAKATRVVHKRGGLIASQTGFGKTPTMISLVKHQESQDRNYGQQQSVEKIHSAATLVIVPTQLVDQWASEITRFSVNSQVVIKIKKAADLQALTLSQVRDANWIVVNMNVVMSDAYILDLSRFAGLLEPEKNASSRAKDAWYKTAVQNISKNLGHLMREPSSIADLLEKQLEAHTNSVAEFKAPIPSKRLTGAKYLTFAERHSKKLKPDLPELPQNISPESKKRKAEPKLKDIESASKKRKVGTKKKSKAVANDAPYSYKLFNNNYSSMKHTVFEMFAFARIVVDEAHYSTSDLVRFISSMERYATWLLTATPSLNTFHDVKRIAKMLGIYLGKSDYASMANDVYKTEIADMTASEKIQAIQPLPSSFWLLYRQSLAQKFLDLFARRDDADKKDIKSFEKVILVRQPAIERSAYLETEQALAPNNFEILSKNKQGGHYNLQIQDALSNYKFGLQALMYRASNFDILQYRRPDTKYTSTLSIQTSARDSDIQDVQREVKYHLERCVWLSKLPDCQIVRQYTDFKSRMLSNHLGDGEVTAFLKELINKTEAGYKESNWKNFFYEEGVEPSQKSEKEKFPSGYGKVRGQTVLLSVRYLRNSVAKLVYLSETLVKFYRVHRFAHQVQGVQQLVSGQVSKLKCDRCARSLACAADLTILSRCGHQVCIECRATLDNSCSVKNCKSVVVEYELVSGSEFLISQRPLNLKVDREYGSKIEAVVKTLLSIKKMKEYTLLFVQDARSIENLKNAMTSQGVKYEHIGNGTKASTVLTKFQNGKTTATVLILNIGDASAAGANLTRANHVMFFNPYWTRMSIGQSKYVAAMEQAMGRAIRWGQKKPVYVYHFLTAGTVDVDYFEFRNQQIIQVPDATNPTSAIAVARQPSDPEKTPFSSHTSLLINFD